MNYTKNKGIEIIYNMKNQKIKNAQTENNFKKDK